MRGMRASPLDECPPGVPSSTPFVACSDASSILLSASSMMFPELLLSVEVSVGDTVEDPVVVPVPESSVIVFAVHDARTPLVPSASTSANVITAFFIICSNAAFCGVFFFAVTKIFLCVPRDYFSRNKLF